MQWNRRQFAAAVGAMMAAPSLAASALEARGVPLGLQTYTFHNVRMGGLGAIDEMITGSQKLKVNLLELWAPQAEPFALPVGYWSAWTGAAGKPAAPSEGDARARRMALRAWRTDTPADYFTQILFRLNFARMAMFAYNYSFEPSMTDAEIDHGFLAAKAMRVNLISSSCRISDAKRVVPFAEKHGIRVAFHGHSEKDDPDQIAGPESFRKVVAMSPLYRINLDVAHFSAAGFDSVAFMKEQREKITHIHVHDRKANNGASVPMGQGITPVKDVLLLLRNEKWKIPVFYELEYVGADGRGVIEETQRELDYEAHILNS